MMLKACRIGGFYYLGVKFYKNHFVFSIIFILKTPQYLHTVIIFSEIRLKSTSKPPTFKISGAYFALQFFFFFFQCKIKIPALLTEIGKKIQNNIFY